MRPEEAIMAVFVNGRKHLIRKDTTVKEMLDQLALRAEHIAVELNRKIIKRAEWGVTKLNPDDKLEIVHFVGGGRKEFTI